MTYSNPYASTSSPTNFIAFSGMGMRKGGRPSLFPGSGDGSTLNLDFTTGVLDPLLTFKRDGNATFVNSSGYVAWAGANTAPYSESLSTGLGYNDNAMLSRSTTTSPTGNTAVVFYPTLVSDYHRLQFGAPIAMVNATTISVYVKQIGSNYRVGINSTGYIGAGAIFSLVGVGSVVAVGGTAANRAATITKVTDDGWYRITITGTYTTLTSTYVFMDSSTSTDHTGGPFTGVASQGVSFWGFQINPGSTAQTYYPTTTAAYNAPRFDYSPTTIGEPRGLLVEGQQVNLALLSNDFTSGTWLYQGSVRSTGSSATPENTASAYTLMATTADVKHQIYQSMSVATATKYTFSVYAKKNGYNRIGLCIGTIANRYTAAFDLTNGTFVESATTTLPPTSPAYSIEPIGTNGWYRCTVSITSSDTTMYPHIMCVNDGTITWNSFAQAEFTGDVAKGIYMYGAQLELGSGASSLITTGASTVTRNADVLAVTSTTTMGLNTSEGTFFVETELPRSGVSTPAPFGTPYSNGSWLGQIYGSADATTLTANWWGGGGLGLSRSGNPKSLTALSYGLYTGTSIPVSSSLNGAVSTGTFTTSGANNAPNPATWNFIALACNATTLSSSRDNISACIKRFKYFPTRLTNAQLQTLTAP